MPVTYFSISDKRVVNTVFTDNKPTCAEMSMLFTAARNKSAGSTGELSLLRGSDTLLTIQRLLGYD